MIHRTLRFALFFTVLTCVSCGGPGTRSGSANASGQETAGEAASVAGSQREAPTERATPVAPQRSCAERVTTMESELAAVLGTRSFAWGGLARVEEPLVRDSWRPFDLLQGPVIELRTSGFATPQTPMDQSEPYANIESGLERYLRTEAASYRRMGREVAVYLAADRAVSASLVFRVIDIVPAEFEPRLYVATPTRWYPVAQRTPSWAREHIATWRKTDADRQHATIAKSIQRAIGSCKALRESFDTSDAPTSDLGAHLANRLPDGVRACDCRQGLDVEALTAMVVQTLSTPQATGWLSVERIPLAASATVADLAARLDAQPLARRRSSLAPTRPRASR